VPVGDAATAGIIADLEAHGDALSHAILRALAHLATGDPATRSADAVARLAENGVGLPRQFRDVGEARAVAAWRDTAGAYAGECALFVEFEHPNGPGHTLALFVDRDFVKHVGLLPPMEGLGYPHDDLEELDLTEAGSLLRKVLDRTYPHELTDPDDFRILIGMARARSM
jgi:GNAT superfamily N-acetyltransferase